jgi:hypothetical protein
MPTQLNVEYFFRLVYDCLTGTCSTTPGGASFSALLAQVWLWIVAVGYLASAVALFIIIYALVRLFDIRKREGDYYGTLLLADEKEAVNPRWTHIESLSGSVNPSDWRTAILEADIMLDEMLTKQGYRGATVAEKLQEVERADFATLGDAWEAHKVRNQIAHQGSSFDLSQTLARRTLAHYEAVFREFEAI